MAKAHPLLKHSSLEMIHISISESQPHGHSWPPRSVVPGREPAQRSLHVASMGGSGKKELSWRGDKVVMSARLHEWVLGPTKRGWEFKVPEVSGLENRWDGAATQGNEVCRKRGRCLEGRLLSVKCPAWTGC